MKMRTALFLSLALITCALPAQGKKGGGGKGGPPPAGDIYVMELGVVLTAKADGSQLRVELPYGGVFPFEATFCPWKRWATVGGMNLTIFGISDLTEIQQMPTGLGVNPDKFPKLFCFRLNEPRELGGSGCSI